MQRTFRCNLVEEGWEGFLEFSLEKGRFSGPRVKRFALDGKNKTNQGEERIKCMAGDGVCSLDINGVADYYTEDMAELEHTAQRYNITVRDENAIEGHIDVKNSCSQSYGTLKAVRTGKGWKIEADRSIRIVGNHPLPGWPYRCERSLESIIEQPLDLRGIVIENYFRKAMEDFSKESPDEVL